MSKPRVLSDEERRKRANARTAAWRRKNPWRWKKIWQRAYAKRKAAGKAGVEVELDLSGAG